MGKRLEVKQFGSEEREEEIYLNSLHDHYILDVIDKLKEINKKYTHFNFDYYDDDSRLEIYPFLIREETDEEFQKRVDEKERMMKNYLPIKEQLDRVEYERLKKLFYNEEEEFQKLKLKFENK